MDDIRESLLGGHSSHRSRGGVVLARGTCEGGHMGGLEILGGRSDCKERRLHRAVGGGS